mgnify:CR=1 FL=1
MHDKPKRKHNSRMLFNVKLLLLVFFAGTWIAMSYRWCGLLRPYFDIRPLYTSAYPCYGFRLCGGFCARWHPIESWKPWWFYVLPRPCWCPWYFGWTSHQKQGVCRITGTAHKQFDVIQHAMYAVHQLIIMCCSIPYSSLTIIRGIPVACLSIACSNSALVRNRHICFLPLNQFPKR